MPGLSQYKDKVSDPLVIDAPEGADWVDDMIPGLSNRMRQRYLDSLGFADPARSFPDILMHGMLQNVPRDQWDKSVVLSTPGEPQEIGPGWWMQTNDYSKPYTLRQLMETLGKMAPNERQNP